MNPLHYQWQTESATHSLDLVFVEGTRGSPYTFGEGAETRSVEVPDFYLAAVPVTQALWTHLMGEGSNHSCVRGDHRPVENVSWDEITAPGGFLERINASEIAEAVAEQAGAGIRPFFRLPSETEWEYAARGGPHWRDGWTWSGSNEIEAVAWYKDNSGNEMRVVGLKAANQLGLYDMSGNAWEWCQDSFTRDVNEIPADGRPFTGPDERRVLRGGCFHNWAVHCTVSKRYEIGRMFGDGCISFRLAFATH